jgi:hypothetical protein
MTTHIFRILAVGIPVLLSAGFIRQCGTTLGPGMVLASPFKEARPENESAPRKAVERAVGRLELVFFEDQSRRKISGLMIGSGKDLLFVTASTACVVPHGVPPAIDRALLEIHGKPPVSATYDPGSTSELFVYRVPGVACPYQVQDVPAVRVGDAISAVHPDAKGELRVAVVKALKRTAEFKLANGATRKLEELLELDRRFPEGTPLLSDGGLVGIVVVGTRFGVEGGNTSFAVPASRIQELARKRAAETK